MTEVLQPEGIRSVVISKLARMVAQSAAFAEACGLDDWEQVLEKHVHYPSLFDPDGIKVFPFAIIGLVPGGGFERYRVSGGASTNTLPRGSIRLVIGRTFDEEVGGKDPLIRFLNWSDAVVDDIQSLSGVDDNLNLVGWQEISEAQRTDPKRATSETYYDNWFDVNWDAI